MTTIKRKAKTFSRLLKQDRREISIAIFNNIVHTHITDILADTVFLKWSYRINCGHPLDIAQPITFNEKLQWLKLHDRRPKYTMMVDKYAVKDYVAGVIGPEHIVPILGVWDDPDKINFDALPDQFVLKCNHDSGSIVICKDKAVFDKKAAVARLKRGLKRNGYLYGREWPYKNVKPRIIAEKYMTDESGMELKDYKFFCFDGVVKCFKVDFDRFIEHHANYYDRDGNRLDFGEAAYPPDPKRNIKLPKNIDQMIDFAERLSKGMPFLRVDFYDVNETVYFGELTFYPASGFGKFEPEEWDAILGQWLELPKATNPGW